MFCGCVAHGKCVKKAKMSEHFEISTSSLHEWIGNSQASLTDDTCWDVPGGNTLDPAPDKEETLPCCCNRNSRDLQPDATHDAEFLASFGQTSGGSST